MRALLLDMVESYLNRFSELRSRHNQNRGPRQRSASAQPRGWDPSGESRAGGRLLTTAEVADVLGVEPATVRQRVHRARLMLRGYPRPSLWRDISRIGRAARGRTWRLARRCRCLHEPEMLARDLQEEPVGGTDLEETLRTGIGDVTASRSSRVLKCRRISSARQHNPGIPGPRRTRARRAAPAPRPTRSDRPW
jgi:hypothetical protein